MLFSMALDDTPCFYDHEDWKREVVCHSATDMCVRDRLFGLLFIHAITKFPELPPAVVLNAHARTTVDQVNESCLRRPVGDGAFVHGLLLLDQVPLNIQSIPNVCAGLLQSYIHSVSQLCWTTVVNDLCCNPPPPL